MPKAKTEMVKVNLRVGKSNRIWETVEVPLKWMECLEAIARKRRITVDAVFCEVLTEMMMEDRVRRAQAA